MYDEPPYATMSFTVYVVVDAHVPRQLSTWPGARSARYSDLSSTLLDVTAPVASFGLVTAPFCSWVVPTLPAGSAVAAYAPPDTATTSARVAVTLAYDTTLRTRFIGLSPLYVAVRAARDVGQLVPGPRLGRSAHSEQPRSRWPQAARHRCRRGLIVGFDGVMHPRAGQPAQPEDLVDVAALLQAYDAITPDVTDPAQKVVFGTSGHRGSSLDGAFNETHILAITQAICEYRAGQGTTGPLLIGRDSHGLSEPAWRTALEVLVANDVQVLVDSADRFTPTPAVSHAILRLNRSGAGPQADGIVVTPSHNPPRDGGFKYNPPHGGPAGSDATGWIADRANELIAARLNGVRRLPFARARAEVGEYDFVGHYVDDLPRVLDLDAIRSAGVRIGADPLGGASVDYWSAIAERHKLDLTVVNPRVDPTWRFMTLDHDGKIRMDCSSPYAMASLVAQMRDEGSSYDVATGND